MKNRSAAILIVLLLLLNIAGSFAVSANETDFSVNYKVTDINGTRAAMSVIVYTPEFGEKTATSGQGVELAVDNSGKIISVGKSKTEIPKQGFVISFGPATANKLPEIGTGDYAVFDDKYNCVTIISKGYSPFCEYTLVYDAINAARAENKMIIYRDRDETKTNTWGVEAVVNADGVIVSVGGNNNKIPEGGFVISGVGDKKQPIIDSCVPGYTAVLDESTKTVTVSYTNENAYSSYELRLKELEEKVESATLNFADVDYKKIGESVGIMKATLESIKGALETDDIVKFIVDGYRFDNEVEILKTALVPYIPVETRTLWLRIPTSSNLSTVKKTVNDIYEMGFNSVCIEVLFDSTMIMPMPNDSLFEQNPAFDGQDMLKLYIDEFHDYGIEVHAWVSCYRVGHDGSKNINSSVAKKKPEWLNIDQNGKESVTNEYGNAYFLNPALPEVREFLLKTYRYILENYEIDGFQLDYVRYPENSTVNYGYDEYTVSQFTEKYNFEKVPTGSSQKGWTEWCQFRASFVTELVKKTGALIKEIRPDVIFSCDVAPGYESTKIKMCQDTETWLKEGLVDAIYPMAYGTTDAVIKWTNNTVELSGDGIQTVIGLRDNGCETYREQIIASRECGADGTAFFSYSQYVSGNYKEYIKNSVFSKEAACPSYNAKSAVVAQLEHIRETIDNRIVNVIDSNGSKADKAALKSFAEKIDSFAGKLNDKKLSELKTELDALVGEGKALAEKYVSETDKVSDNISKYILSSIRIVEKAAINSLDDEKDAYKQTLTPDVEDVSETEKSDTDEFVEPVEENASYTTIIVVSVCMVTAVLVVLIIVILKRKNKNK